MLATRVCVIGSLNMDLVVRCARLPHPGETVLGGAFERHPGGKGANQAVAAARAGAQVALIGALGDDTYGDELARVVGAAGVDVARVARRTGTPSGVALITVSAAAENSIVVAPGANATLAERDVEAAADALRRARVVVAQLEVPLAAVACAASIAHAARASFVLNAAPACELPRELLALVDVLVVNRGEACALLARPASTPDAELARALVERGVRAVALTLGARGALLATAAEVVAQSAFPVEAVDSTGAGDAFVGAFAAALASGLGEREALRRGCAGGALATQRHGALPSLPSAAQIDALLDAPRTG